MKAKAAKDAAKAAVREEEVGDGSTAVGAPSAARPPIAPAAAGKKAKKTTQKEPPPPDVLEPPGLLCRPAASCCATAPAHALPPVSSPHPRPPLTWLRFWLRLADRASTADRAGNLYIACLGDGVGHGHTLRKLSSGCAPRLSTVAGCAGEPGHIDGRVRPLRRVPRQNHGWGCGCGLALIDPPSPQVV
eukprot:SAG11_NODE_36_length_21869_cov_38.038999_1_plen_189_part_00